MTHSAKTDQPGSLLTEPEPHEVSPTDLEQTGEDEQTDDTHATTLHVGRFDVGEAVTR